MTRVTAKPVISQDRAERVAKGHACENCGEYSYKRLVVKPATPAQRKSMKEAWHAFKTCGVCGLDHEMGIAADGEVIYVN